MCTQPRTTEYSTVLVRIRQASCFAGRTKPRAQVWSRFPGPICLQFMLDGRDQKSATHRKTEEERAKVILFYYSPPGTAIEMTAESEILWPIPRGVAFSPPPPPLLVGPFC